MTMNNLSRRVAITGICAAVAVPVTVTPALANADAELIALGKEMDRLDALMADARIRAKPNYDAYRRGIAAFAGRQGHVPNSEYDALFARVDAEFPVAFPEPDDVSDMMDPLSRRIMAIPAATLAGLAVKARLYQSHCEDLWGKPADSLDWDDKVAKSVVDAVLSLAAVQA